MHFSFDGLPMAFLFGWFIMLRVTTPVVQHNPPFFYETGTGALGWSVAGAGLSFALLAVFFVLGYRGWGMRPVVALGSFIMMLGCARTV
jgi:hypothetical protein